MAAKPFRFKQVELERALKGALKVGLNPTSAEIGADGRIVLGFGEAQKAPMSEFDQWKSRRDARPT